MQPLGEQQSLPLKHWNMPVLHWFVPVDGSSIFIESIHGSGLMATSVAVRPTGVATTTGGVSLIVCRAGEVS